MKKVISQFIILMFLTLISCKTSNENKIIGKWKGTNTQKMYYGGNIHKSITTMEFDENGKGWYQNYNEEENKTYRLNIFEYKIKLDSVIFIPKKYDTNLHIEYISANKLILNKFSESMGTITYELDKVNN
jgi:hypothetical protein